MPPKKKERDITKQRVNEKKKRERESELEIRKISEREIE